MIVKTREGENNSHAQTSQFHYLALEDMVVVTVVVEEGKMSA